MPPRQQAASAAPKHAKDPAPVIGSELMGMTLNHAFHVPHQSRAAQKLKALALLNSSWALAVSEVVNAGAKEARVDPPTLRKIKWTGAPQRSSTLCTPWHHSQAHKPA